MRVVKTIKKQKELAKAGNLYIIANCRYIKVDEKEWEAMQGVKFYSRNA